MKGVQIDLVKNCNSNKFPKVNGFKNLNKKSSESTNSLKKDMRRSTMIEPRNFILLDDLQRNFTEVKGDKLIKHFKQSMKIGRNVEKQNHNFKDSKESEKPFGPIRLTTNDNGIEFDLLKETKNNINNSTEYTDKTKDKALEHLYFNDLDHQLENPEKEKSTQIKVIGRFRPLNSYEEDLCNKEAGQLCAKYINKSTISITTSNNNKHEYTLDAIFDPNTTQDRLYKEVVSETISDILNGYNGTVFCYGQSGSGKTFTMFGNDINDEVSGGIIPRAINQIFDHIENENNNNLYVIKFSILEIYKERLYDLLNPSNNKDLKIKENQKTGIFVDNLTSFSVEDRNLIFLLLERADENRNVAETRLNRLSSRSHVVFFLFVEQTLSDGTEKLGVLNLVDLAGSEKVSKSGAVGETLEEAKKINSSLSSLGNVINALTSNKGDFVPYRDSKLTRLLQDSLGGNFKTTLIVTCSPHSFNVDETISTLNFAKRAKNVKNMVKANIIRSSIDLEKIIIKLTEQINNLKEDNEKLLLERKIYDSNSSSKSSINENNDIDPLYPSDYSVLLKEKEMENEKLRDEIEKLKNEKDDLQQKLTMLTLDLKLDETIQKLENSIKTNIDKVENLHNIYNRNIEFLYKEENIELKKRLIMKESKELDDLKNLMSNEFNFNLTSKLQSVNLHINQYLEKLKSNIESDQYLYTSYENIFKSSKMFLNDLLHEFIKKSDIFQHSSTINSKEQEEQIIVDKKKYLALKNSYVKSNALIIYYEKLINDFFGKFVIDLKNYEINEKYSKEISSRIWSVNTTMYNYLEVLKEIKLLKNNQAINDLEIHKPEKNFGSKFLRRVGEKSSKKNLNLLLSFIKGKLPKRKSERSDQDTFNLNNRKESSDYVFSKSPLGEVNNDNINEKETIQSNENETYYINPTWYKSSFVQRNSVPEVVHKTNKLETINSEVDACNHPISNDSNELILYKKNKLLNQVISNLTREVTELHSKSVNFDKMIVAYQKTIHNTFKKQIENLRLTNSILKDFYNEEMVYSKNINTHLSNMIDEILINEKLFKDAKHKKIISKYILNSESSFYLEKKGKIENKEIISSEKTMSSVAEAFINESGTATKKLDYLYISLNKDEEFQIMYGSGLGKKTPTKSPLHNNLNNKLSGDIGDYLNTPEEY